MDDAGLTTFIVSYINNRKQLKRDALDKAAEKTNSDLPGEALSIATQELAQARQDLESRYDVRNWLSDAALRAGQINLVTHALKFTHSDARGSSVLSNSLPEDEPEYLSTATLPHPAIDAVGNAAALDVAKLLQTEYQGDSLVAALRRDDYSALAPLAESEQQLEQWVTGFKQVLTDKQPSSHKLAKQLYFPISDNEYHLLGPLYSSSLAQALYQRINTSRFSDEAKSAREARKNNRWHDGIDTAYPNIAMQNIGGTKPQNISSLNNSRGGKSYLLLCAAPDWQSIPKPPKQYKSIFRDRGEFDYLARPTVKQMQQFLLSVKDIESDADIRVRRLAYNDSIIDILFNYVAVIQNMDDGWSKEECELKRSQQLWLDPYRSQSDPEFKFEREGGDWKKEVAQDFGFWLNRHLDSEQMKFSEVERREWSTADLFKQRMREFEHGLAEDIK
jgi:CRISPR-associated protein Csy1